jgi:hypothetical protein
MFAGYHFAPINLRTRFTHDAPACGRCERIIGWNNPGELAPLREFRVCNDPPGIWICNRAVGREEPGTVRFPCFRGQVDQEFTSGSGRLPELRAHRRCRLAAEGPHVEWSPIGVAHHHADGGRRYSQFLGHRLRE